MAKEDVRKQISWIFLSTLALIFLIIVVFIILFFWKGGTKPVDPVNVQCKFFCDTNQTSGFCKFQVRFNGNSSATCNQLSSDSKYTQYNVKPCQTISCASPIILRCVQDLGGNWITPINGKCPTGNGLVGGQVTATDTAPKAGQICCV